MKINGHGPDFQKEYAKWSGNTPSQNVTTLHSEYGIKPKQHRKSGKTLSGKWRVEYIRYNYKNGGIYCETVKEKPTTKTESMKIFKMACSKDYPAWLQQYVSSVVVGGWKVIEYHESVNGGQRNLTTEQIEMRKGVSQ